MANPAKVRTASGTWVDLAVQSQDISNYSTTTQMNTAISTNAGLNLITSANIGTSVSSVTVSNCFNSTYDNYRIILSGATQTVNGNWVYIQFNNSIGATYYTSGVNENYTGGSPGALAINGSSVAGFGITHANGMNAMGDILNPFLSRYTVTHSFWQSDVASGFLSSVDKNNVSNTGFTITFGGGAITGGTIKVYGYKN